LKLVIGAKNETETYGDMHKNLTVGIREAIHDRERFKREKRLMSRE